MPAPRTDRRPLSFLDGVGVGLCSVALLPLLAMLVQGGAFRDMYRDFGDVHLPVWTQVVLHPAWRIGVPCVAIALAAAVLVRRPRFRYAMIVVAVVVAIAAAATYVGAYLPVFQLAGSISPG